LGLSSLDALYALPDADRDLWVARWHRDKEQCQSCGHPRSECSDPAKVWHANRVTCHATRARLAAQGLWDQLHADKPFHDGTESSWDEKRSMSHPYRYDEGVTIVAMLEDLTPDDKFLTPPDPFED
jgi:hypothetical protein